jgi:hypothetical protein
MTKKVVTNDGKKGGWLVGKRHYDKNGKPLGGIKAVVTDAGDKPVELEGGEVIINREASKKHWKELSRINQSAGNGVAIEPPSSAFDEDPTEDYENGGKIEFNANHIPNKWILNYAIKIKEEHKDVWDLGGNIFGNQAFTNLKRVAERGYWLDSEEWMYKKWRSYVARHQRDYRIEGVIAMLKWVDKVEKGWQYMKNLIEEEIKKREAKKLRKMSNGGNVDTYNKGEVWRINSVDYYFDESYIDNNGVKKWKTYKVFSTPRDKYTGTKSIILSKTITDKRLKEFADVGKKYGMEVTDLFDIKYNDGGSTPAPLKDRIKGSKFNEKGTASTSSKAESIKFDDKTISSIQSLIDAHNEKYPSKKITLAVAKAVVRRGMGAYSSSHRTTITDGKPNSRTAWGLARLKAFIYKAQTGKSKSGKYSQDNDLFEELNISVQKMNKGGDVRGMSWYSDFKKEQLKKGTEHELEHKDTIEKFKRKGVSDRQVAEQIAKDHLEEDENYYIELDKMESKKFATGGGVTTYDVDTEGIWGGRGKPRIKVVSISAKTVKYLDYSDNKVKSDTKEKFDRLFTPDTSLISSQPSTQTTSKPFKSTESITWLEEYEIGDYVAVRPDIADFLQIPFDTNENIFKITDKTISGTSKRKENPSGALYNLDQEYGSKLLQLEGRDIYLISKSKPSTQPSQPATTTSSSPLNDFRIKTEKEFESEYGSKWRDTVNWSMFESMDWLFGKRLGEILKKGNEKEDFSRVIAKSYISSDPSLDAYGKEWSINSSMWVYDPVSSQQTQSKAEYVLKKPLKREDLYDIKIIVDTPEKSEAFQKAAFDLDFSWDKGKKDILNTQAPYLFIDNEFSTEYEFGFGNNKNSDFYENNANKELFFDDLFELKGSKTSTIAGEPVTETNVVHELNNYRILNEKEIKDIFGLINQIPNWPRNMDIFIGKKITEIVSDYRYDSVLFKIQNNQPFRTDIPETWNIDPRMYVFDADLYRQNVKQNLGKEIEQTSDVKSQKDLLSEEYNDVLFLISITPTTDIENMLSLKARAKELKDALDLIDLELRKKAQTELTLLDELFSASTIKPQERYKFTPYSDGFAPDGQPTSLPKNIYDWTMTEEFQNWFGNFTLAYNYRNSSYENVPCSVVVNKNYEPLIVYHGTGSEFSFFKFDSFPAMYFAENEAYSNWFAEMKGQQNGTQGYVYPFVLNIRTPLDLTLFETNKISAAEFVDWMYLQTGLDENELKINKALLDPSLKNQAWVYLRNSPEMLKVLRDKNVCDGIIYYEDNPSVDASSEAYKTKAYIVFNANSAKIANNERHIQTIPAMRSFFLKRGGKL